MTHLPGSRCPKGHGLKDWSQTSFEPGTERGGLKHEASSRVGWQFREEAFERMTPRDRALVRSQSGPGGSLALTTAPTSVLTKIPPHLFRVVLLRRLRLPLPLSPHACRCLRPIDPFGHHRAACVMTGALGRQGFALESAAARVCREAGGRVTTNVMLRDLDLPVPDATDSRWLEVVVDGRLNVGVCSSWCRNPPTLAQQTQTAQSSSGRGGEKSEGTQSWLALAVARVSSYLPLRWAAGGQLAKSKDRNHASCRRESSKLGGCGGEPSLHAQRQRSSAHVCWT